MITSSTSLGKGALGVSSIEGVILWISYLCLFVLWSLRGSLNLLVGVLGILPSILRSSLCYIIRIYREAPCLATSSVPQNLLIRLL